MFSVLLGFENIQTPSPTLLASEITVYIALKKGKVHTEHNEKWTNHNHE